VYHATTLTAHRVQTVETNVLRPRSAEALRTQSKGPGTQQQSRQITSFSTKKVLKPRKGPKGLPLSFFTATGTREIVTKHDTGTMANHISLDLAKELGYPIDYSSKLQGQFKMANGKIITAVGRIAADVAFPQNGRENKMICHFNVFKTLAFPALIGMAFLHATETLSRYTSRLVSLPDDYRRSFRLYSVGEATNEARCFIDGNPVIACADTGAEIALISAEYALRYNMVLNASCEELMLADGTLDYTSGFADVRFKPLVYMKSRKVRFHVLESLQFEVLLDEDLVEDYALFLNNSHPLVYCMTETIPSIAPIIHLGSKFERGIANVGDKMRGWTNGLLASKTQSTPASTGSAQGTIAPTPIQPYNTDLTQTLLTIPTKLGSERIRNAKSNNASMTSSRSTIGTGLEQAGSRIPRQKQGVRWRSS
jgi:hypothetical protein